MTILSTQDHLELVQLTYQSFWLIDNGRAAETAQLFADDARLTFGEGAPRPGTIAGQAISDAMRARQDETAVTSRHILSNPIVEPASDESVTVRTCLTLFRASDDLSPVIRSVADIIDVWVRRGDSWAISHRQILPVFTAG